MSLYRSLVSHNPMKAEIQRFRNRYLRRGGKSGAGFAITAIACFGYVFVLLWIGIVSQWAAPIVISQVCLGFITLGIPAVGYATIAGERERRSWDALLVAPITSAQIVVGKFLAIAYGLTWVIGITAAIHLMFFIGIDQSAYRPYSGGYIPMSIGEQLLAYLVIYSWGLLLIAITLFFSARCKRSLSAFGIVLGLLFTSLILIPGIASASRWDGSIDPTTYFHPFLTVVELLSPRGIMYTEAEPPPFHSWICLAAYLVFSAIFIVWTEFTLRFADGDVKFIRRNHA